MTRRAIVTGAGVAVAAAVVGCGARDRPGAATTDEAILGSTTDVPVGGGTVFADREVVVTQPIAGTFHAFSAICTHRGCTVNEVDGATIMCPCHGSRFSSTDGSVVQGPAQQPLPVRRVTVVGSSLTLT